jgi:amino acid transporter
MSIKKITTLPLIMINIIAVANLRGIPFAAKMGIASFSYYLIATLIFFIPTALVTAELATSRPNKGGIYVWVKEAFGDFMGFITIWLQWIYNVVWYPTILTFVAANIAYLIEPGLEKNNIYTWLVITLLFWGATFINYFGLRVSGFVSTLGAIIGTLSPMVIVSALGIFWLLSGNPTTQSINWENISPNFNNTQNLSFFCFIIFGLIGIEMSAVHAEEVENPKKAYPQAILISGCIIFVSLVAATLAVALVVDSKTLSVTTGFIQAFHKMLEQYNASQILPFIIISVIVGSISSVVTWIIGPTKGLLVAGRNKSLPQWFAKTNENDVPVNILLLQACVFSILSFGYIFIPNVDGVYEVLSILTTQLALIVYILMFLSVIRLRKTNKATNSFQVPGGNIGLNITALIGITTCLIVMVIGFIPPPNLNIGVNSYILILSCSLIALISPAIFLYHYRRKSIIPPSL